MPSGTIIMPSGAMIMPSGTIWPDFLSKLASVAPAAPAAAGGSGTEALPGKLGVRTKTGSFMDPGGPPHRVQKLPVLIHTPFGAKALPRQFIHNAAAAAFISVNEWQLP